MAGHSKWANIKHKKAKQDALKGKVFTKLIRELTVAARSGGGEPQTNSRLRAAIQAAYAANMSRDTVERAITRGLGEDDAANVEEIRYEGYGVGGVAVMVDCMTDNRNRTAGEVRHAFSKCGGNLGTSGSVAFLFTQRGVIHFAAGVSEDKVMELALEQGAEDVVVDDAGGIDVMTTPELFSHIQEALVKSGLTPERAEVTELPSTYAELTDLESAQKILKLTEMLEELDDVQKVYTNADISDAIAAAL